MPGSAGLKLVRPPGTRPPAVVAETHARPRSLPIPVRAISQSDDHYPIVDKYYEAALFAFARDFKPDTWIHGGDRYDMWSLSRYDKEPERWFSGDALVQQEFDSGEESWKEICRIAERVYFLKGNHEARWEALIKANLGLFGLRGFNWHTMAGIPQKVQIYSPGTILDLGGIAFEHGDTMGGKFGVLHAANWALMNRLSNVIFGHTHRIDIRHRTFRRDGQKKQIVAINQGHGSDVSKQKYAGVCPNWQHGFTAIEWYTVAGKPRFTTHVISVVDGRFIFGGKVYDGKRLCQ